MQLFQSTSCSAERALGCGSPGTGQYSHQCMCDEWMKALMVLASAKYILSSTTTDDVIDNFTHMSDRLAKQLLLV